MPEAVFLVERKLILLNRKFSEQNKTILVKSKLNIKRKMRQCNRNSSDQFSPLKLHKD